MSSSYGAIGATALLSVIPADVLTFKLDRDVEPSAVSVTKDFLTYCYHQYNKLLLSVLLLPIKVSTNVNSCLFLDDSNKERIKHAGGRQNKPF